MANTEASTVQISNKNLFNRSKEKFKSLAPSEKLQFWMVVATFLMVIVSFFQVCNSSKLIGLYRKDRIQKLNLKFRLVTGLPSARPKTVNTNSGMIFSTREWNQYNRDNKKIKFQLNIENNTNEQIYDITLKFDLCCQILDNNGNIILPVSNISISKSLALTILPKDFMSSDLTQEVSDIISEAKEKYFENGFNDNQNIFLYIKKPINIGKFESRAADISYE